MKRFKDSRKFSWTSIPRLIATLLFCGIGGSLGQRLPAPIPPSIGNLLTPGTAPPSEYTYRYNEVLNSTLGFSVSWDSSRTWRTITFNVTAPLNGNGSAVVFGLSKRGQVQGSDVVVIAVGRDGQPFILDMHGVQNNTISRDSNQSWILLRNATRVQNGSIVASIRRPFDTCDDQDILLNSDMVHLVYGFTRGNISNSTSTLPFTPSGSSRQYLLDPTIPPSRTEQNSTQTFRISRRFQVPPRHTSYWCTIHKGPSFQRKHHITGFTPVFGDEAARRHIHHQLVYRCITPPGVDPSLVFQRYVNHPGEECYLEQRHQLPTIFCTEILHTFGLGGGGYTFPDDIGLALGETTNEYFMLESHYDNPDQRSDLVLDHGVDFQYSSQVRPIDGSIVLMGTGILGIHLVPPRSTEWPQIGQCGPECTRQVVPLTGMQVMGTLLHAHQYTHKIRARHFRGNRELPYINADNNYDFSFQRIRHVANSSLILPGDRIVIECTMDTNSRNTTLLSGFSTRDEMCATFAVVNKRLSHLYCLSELPTDRTMERFGIQNMTWDRELQERIVNQASDQSMVGQTLANAIRNYNWTPERRDALRQQQNFDQHDAACPNTRRMAMQAYLAYFVEGITGGLFSRREQIENSRPSTRTVSTPKGPFLPELSVTRMPREVTRYIPQEPCTEIINTNNANQGK